MVSYRANREMVEFPFDLEIESLKAREFLMTQGDTLNNTINAFYAPLRVFNIRS